MGHRVGAGRTPRKTWKETKMTTLGGGHTPMVPHMGAEELSDVGNQGVYHQRIINSLQMSQHSYSCRPQPTETPMSNPQGDRAAVLGPGASLSSRLCQANLGKKEKGGPAH